jgi:hypothetical protein
MKYVTTIICCLAFAFAGWSLATSDNNELPDYHQTISAATLPKIGPNMLPLDVQLDLNKRDKELPDTVYVPNDTMFVKTPDIVINLVRKHASTQARATMKRVGDSIPAAIPDTLVKNKVDVGREEQPTDTIRSPRSIILIVDNEEVYKR